VWFRPTRTAADRSSHFERVAYRELVVQESGDLTVRESFDGQLDRRAVGWGRRDGVGALRGVAVGCGEPHEQVLPRKVLGRRRQGEREGLDARGLGADVADGRELPRADRGNGGFGVQGSVALVALFEPWVAAIVVAAHFPESGFVVVENMEAGYPLGALPEVEVRHE
jgi:hypothetical protein